MELTSGVRPGFHSEVLVLIGSAGRIEGAQNLSPRSKAAFDRVLPRITAASVSFRRPDERPVKIVRRGILACNRLSNCSLVFDIPGVSMASDR